MNFLLSRIDNIRSILFFEGLMHPIGILHKIIGNRRGAATTEMSLRLNRRLVVNLSQEIAREVIRTISLRIGSYAKTLSCSWPLNRGIKRRLRDR